MKTLCIFAALVAASFAVACGGMSSPASPSPAVTIAPIIPPEQMPVGECENFACFGDTFPITLSRDGSTATTMLSILPGFKNIHVWMSSYALPPESGPFVFFIQPPLITEVFEREWVLQGGATTTVSVLVPLPGPRVVGTEMVLSTSSNPNEITLETEQTRDWWVLKHCVRNYGPGADNNDYRVCIFE